MNLAKKAGITATLVARRVFTNEFDRKKEFVMGLLRNPVDAVYKEFIQPLEMAGKFFGKATYLACTDPRRLANAGYRTAEQFIEFAQRDPEGIVVAGVGLFVNPSLKKLVNVRGLIAAVQKNKQVMAFAEKCKQVTDQAKKQALAPLKTLGERATKNVNEACKAILKNGYYEVNGFKFSEYYYKKLWNTGRGAPSLVAQEILVGGSKTAIPDTIKKGFYKYVYGGWEMIYNPKTKEVWHLQPVR